MSALITATVLSLTRVGFHHTEQRGTTCCRSRCNLPRPPDVRLACPSSAGSTKGWRPDFCRSSVHSRSRRQAGSSSQGFELVFASCAQLVSSSAIDLVSDLLAGDRGNGKSTLLYQAVNYCLEQNWIVCYVPKGLFISLSSHHPSFTPLQPAVECPLDTGRGRRTDVRG